MDHRSNNDPIPEAEEYPYPETDQMETLTVSSEDGSESRQSFHYEHVSSGGDWSQRIRAGLILRVLMLGLSGICFLVSCFQAAMTVVNLFISLITLFQNPEPIHNLTQSMKSCFRWVLMTFCALVAIISPGFGIMLMMMLLVAQESDSFSAHLKERLQGYSQRRY